MVTDDAASNTTIAGELARLMNENGHKFRAELGNVKCFAHVLNLVVKGKCLAV